MSLRYDSLKKINLKCIDKPPSYDAKDLDLLKFQIQLIDEIKDTFTEMVSCIVDNHKSTEPTYGYMDHELITKEFNRREEFLVMYYSLLYENPDETKSELYEHHTNAKEEIIRKDALKDMVTVQAKLNSLNEFDDNFEINEDDYMMMKKTDFESKENSKVQGFFEGFEEVSDDINKRKGNERQIFMSHNRVKLLIDYGISFFQLFYLYFKRHGMCYMDLTSTDLCKLTILYGIPQIEYEKDLKLGDYTLLDVDIAMKLVIEYHYYIFNIRKFAPDKYQEVVDELQIYVNVLFFRFCMLAWMIEKEVKYLNVEEYVKVDNNIYICSLSCYMNFINIYKYFKTLFGAEKYYFSTKHFKRYDLNKRFQQELDKKDIKEIGENRILFLKEFFEEYKPEQTYQLQNRSSKLLVLSHLKENYLYLRWNKLCNMKAIFDSYNDESNYQNAVLNYYLPSVKEKINDIYQMFCIKPIDIFSLNEQESKKVEEYLKYIESIDKESNVEPVAIDLMKPIIANNMVLVLVHLWFVINRNYHHFLHRFVILDTTICSSRNFYDIINDEIHDEPYIVRESVYKYSVIYKGNYYECKEAGDDNVDKALYIWLTILKDKCDGKIRPIKFHKKKNYLDYYPWIAKWLDFSKNQTQLFGTDNKAFYTSLTEDKVDVIKLFGGDYQTQKVDCVQSFIEDKLERVLNDEEMEEFLKKMKKVN